jgi:hypothetical protein
MVSFSVIWKVIYLSHQENEHKLGLGTYERNLKHINLIFILSLFRRGEDLYVALIYLRLLVIGR